MMGFQHKFNPIILKLKSLLKKKVIGEPYFVGIHHGEHIKDFHPYEDYKKSYAARKVLGGGVILSQIHELDYMIFLFDDYKIKFQNSIVGKISDLDIDVEDTCAAQFLLSQKNKKIICQIHTNFYEKPKKRQINIIGKRGKIFCDLNSGKIITFSNNKKKSFHFKIERNKIFLNEIKYFIKHVKKNKKIDKKLDLLNGAKSLRLAMELKKNDI